MKNLDKLAVKLHRQELQALLDAYGKKHKMTITIGRITYDHDGFRFPVEAIRLSANIVKSKTTADDNTSVMRSSSPSGNTSDPDYARFAYHVSRAGFKHGVELRHFGMTYTSATGKQYTVCGFNPRNHKYPIIVRNTHGARYKYGAYILSKLK